MCLGVPGQVLSIDGYTAVLDVWGRQIPVRIDTIPEQVKVGDFILEHAGYAVELATGKMYYRRDMPLEGFMHYNAVPMAANPTVETSETIAIADNLIMSPMSLLTAVIPLTEP